jgi:hypothetical protein
MYLAMQRRKSIMANSKACGHCGGVVQATSPRATNKRFCNKDCYEAWWSDKKSKQVTRGEWAERRYGPVPTKSLTEPEKAWLAAIIDGEGCIGVHRSRCAGNRSGFKFQPSVTFANTNTRLIEKFADLTDCWATMKRLGNGGNPRAKISYSVQIRRRAVGEFLRQIMPYLVAKREQAENVLQFMALLETSPMRTSADHSIFDVFYERTKQLNKRGV